MASGVGDPARPITEHSQAMMRTPCSLPSAAARSAARALAVACKTFDPTSGTVVDMFTAGRDALDWLCGR
jgi:hypothetical protein